jgi:hypothetical protein
MVDAAKQSPTTRDYVAHLTGSERGGRSHVNNGAVFNKDKLVVELDNDGSLRDCHAICHLSLLSKQALLQLRQGLLQARDLGREVIMLSVELGDLVIEDFGLGEEVVALSL